MTHLLTPLKDNQVQKYLETDSVAGAKWGTYILGYSNVSPEWINGASPAELSVLKYCTMQRQKREMSMLRAGGGGLLG